MNDVKKVRGMEVLVSEEEQQAIFKRMKVCFDKGWLMSGQEQEDFRARFQELTGRQFAETFNSASAALDTMFQLYAKQTSKNTAPRRCAFQANHFPSPASIALRNGYEPVFVDIDGGSSLSPRPDQLDQVYRRTPFDMFNVQWTGGFVAAQVAEIQAWCKERGVKLIEDASHAAGSYGPDGRAAGTYGDIAVFSLASTKALHTGQGGMLLMNTQEEATWAFRGKNYGRTELFQKGQYVQHGSNYAMTELQAAMGNVLFDHLEERTNYRIALAKIMADYCSQVDIALLGSWGAKPNLYKMPVRLPAVTGKGPEELKTFMAERQIELGSKIYDFVTPLLPLFSAGTEADYPETVAYSQSHVCLPIHNKMDEGDAHRVGQALIEFYQA